MSTELWPVQIAQQLVAKDDQLSAALVRLEQERTANAAERAELQAHLRQVEDRAHGEVDRVRQDLKTAKAQVSSQTREHATALRAADQAQRAAEKAQHVAERDSAASRARLEALQLTLSSMRQSPAKKAVAARQRKPAAKLK